MPKRFVLILSLILILAALVQPQMGRAQDEIYLGLLRVDLWPEFDRPEMLVIYKITLSLDKIPTTLTFRIPKEAGQPYKVKVKAEDGNLYEIDYTYRVGSEWGEVTFEVDNPDFQLEYYDPRLVRLGSDRRYAWKAISTQQASCATAHPSRSGRNAAN